MANIANCAVAIDKADLYGLGIKRTAHKNGYEAIFAWEAVDKKSGIPHSITERMEGVDDGENSRCETTYTIDDNHTVGLTEYHRDVSPGLFTTPGTWRQKKNIEWVDGWKIDWDELGTVSYQTTTEVAEYDDHLTIYFGGRWDFPQELADRLSEARWQGAVSEYGMGLYDDTLGNEDFGLRVCEDGGSEWPYVEDTTSIKRRK